MKRTLIATVVLVGLSAQTAVLAQSTVSPSNEPAVPMNTKESDALTPSLNISRDWRVSKLIGTKVTNMQDQSVGAIDDVVLDNDGKVVSVLVSVGGFLGLGEKRVAVAFKELLDQPRGRWRSDREGDTLQAISGDRTRCRRDGLIVHKQPIEAFKIEGPG